MHQGDSTPPSQLSPESLRLKRSFADPCFSSDAEDAEVLGEIPPGPWYLAPSLPKDGVFVVRTEALKEFERRYRDKVDTRGTTDSVSVQSPSPLPVTERRPATWEEVRIDFTSDERVQITVKDKSYTRNYADLGFEDGRKKTPNGAWKILQQLGESHGTISTSSPKDWSKIEKRIQEIRRILRAHFFRQCFEIPADSDPLPFVKGIGYRASFAIATRPSYHS